MIKIIIIALVAMALLAAAAWALFWLLVLHRLKGSML